MTHDADPLRHADLTVLLGMSFQVVLAEFTQRLDAAGYAELRPVHGFVFQQLRGPGLTGTELAQRLGVTKQAVGQIVTELEKRGYVRKAPHPNGGRAQLIQLTERAHDHLDVAGRLLRAVESELADRIGDTDLAHLREQLATLVRAAVGDAIPPLRPIW
ncbi:MarR family transcriptional regulator [Actinokineospora auranticolor]|uniref:DNA-binding MarR family transcriptional regulator n=1 Tax=Actinokineospora auranticolor TaxID=155976 RepID=A0A2S6GET3_9PSEU|nr:MarR family transcriptional regulator [Actinokineospora auranticolor]PPK63710.1 DNA-binding MarR family transcriptional regulator [Actinokineospora auranticolor]